MPNGSPRCSADWNGEKLIKLAPPHNGTVGWFDFIHSNGFYYEPIAHSQAIQTIRRSRFLAGSPRTIPEDIFLVNFLCLTSFCVKCKWCFFWFLSLSLSLSSRASRNLFGSKEPKILSFEPFFLTFSRWAIVSGTFVCDITDKSDCYLCDAFPDNALQQSESYKSLAGV